MFRNLKSLIVIFGETKNDGSNRGGQSVRPLDDVMNIKKTLYYELYHPDRLLILRKFQKNNYPKRLIQAGLFNFSHSLRLCGSA